MDSIRLIIGGSEYRLEGGAFRQMLDAVKSLPHRRFDGEARVWRVSGEPDEVGAALLPFQLSLIIVQSPLADANDSGIWRDRIELVIDGIEFSLVGGDFEDMLEAVKALGHRRFDDIDKAWHLDGTLEEVEAELYPYELI